MSLLPGSMDVVLVVLPFADINRPSIGVSLLKAQLTRAGITCRIEYLNLHLAEKTGSPLYQRLANGLPPDILVGEWFFADAVFADTIPRPEDYVAKVLARYCGPQDTLVAEVMKARESRESFLRDCAERLLQLRPRLVGFTTSFHQTCACLAVARRLKSAAEAPVVVFGGPNCEGEMGLQLLRSFPDVDYVCCGEADLSFPALVENVLGGKEVGPIPGVLQQGVSAGPTPSQPVMSLDGLPFPDYSDYFDQVRLSPLLKDLTIDVPVETSRGCWWGAKKKCIFCGLNRDTILFRSKTPERAFAELAHLAGTYQVKRITSADNILDMKYLPGLFTTLRDSGLDLELFYEVKANLNYNQLAALRQGGVRLIQPGIESFSDQVLSLMRKGCTGLQNLQLLRWAEELGLNVAWNLLAGFPGESPSEYDRMTKLIPLLTHLPPPASCTPIRLDRFSVFFNQAADFGFLRVRPAFAYFYVFPLGGRELAKLAYFFDFDYHDGRRPESYLGQLQREVHRWCGLRLEDAARRPKLEAEFTADGLVITDSREVASAPRHRLTGLTAELYALCDRVQTSATLTRRLGARAAGPLLREALDGLLDTKLLIADGEQVLALAVFRNRNAQH